MTIIALLFLASLSNAVIGLTVVLRNDRQAINRTFFLLSMAVTGWTLTNALYQLFSGEHAQYILALASYGFASLLAVFFYLFCVSLVGKYAKVSSFSSRVFIGFSLVGGFLAVTPGVLAIGIGSQGDIVTRQGVLPVYGLSLCAILLRSVYLLYSLRKKMPWSQKNLTYVILLSFLGALFIGITFNLILPLFGKYGYVSLGPVGSLVLVGGTAYAIVRHRLFDLKLIVARSLAYVTTLSFFGAIYGFIVFGIAQGIFGIHFTILFQIVVSAATGFAALTFAYLKRYFDKVTNRVFFRDAYDTQEFFDVFNKNLVSTIDLNILLKRTSLVIATYMKSEYCVMEIREMNESAERVIGTDRKNFTTEVKSIYESILRLHQEVVVTDYLSDDHDRLRTTLSSNNIAVVVRLAGNLKNSKSGLGFIVLGPKRSGNPYTEKDIKVLVATANELTIALQNALRFEEIERFNETLQEKVDVATRKLRQSNRTLKKLNDTKDDFIGMASHQLRTPLTSVKGYLSLVLEGDAGDITPVQRQLLQQAFTSSQRVIFLIADLLNVSRLRTGKFLIQRAPTNLAKMIDDEISQLREAAAARKITVSFTRPPHFPALPLDEAKTRQVVMNFLDNAIYYGRQDGHIWIELHDLLNSIELRVKDDGIGVPKGEQHQLWTKFFRAKNAQRARPDGTGLGLYMAKKVVVAQGGAILFSSKEGEGSEFGFVFPKDMPEDTVVTSVTSRR